MIKAEDLDLKDKRVLIGVDYNVPLSKGKVDDDERITATFPLLNYCFEKGATQITLMSHLGRPQKEIEGGIKKLENPIEKQKEGVIKKIKAKLDMGPVKEKLKYLLNDPVAIKDFPYLRGKNVQKLDDCIDVTVPPEIDIGLLNNLRFHKDEKKNNPSFAAKFLNYGDVFIQEAFGRCHRAHASTDSIVKAYQNAGKQVAAGPLISKEIEELEKILTAPKEGFVAVLGGVKVSDKIGVIDSLLDHVDTILIGGAMAYTFLKYREGVEVGKSLVEDKIKIGDEKKDAKKVIDDLYKKAEEKGVRIYLPIDHISAEDKKAGSKYESTDGKDIPNNLMGVDIGEKTREQYKQIIAGAKTILWNGPMGVFEVDDFAKGTETVAYAVTDAINARRVIGGGDSTSALKKLGLKEKLKAMKNAHVSTGGGAALEFIEKEGKIPGLLAIDYQGFKQ